MLIRIRLLIQGRTGLLLAAAALALLLAAACGGDDNETAGGDGTPAPGETSGPDVSPLGSAEPSAVPTPTPLLPTPPGDLESLECPDASAGLIGSLDLGRTSLQFEKGEDVEMTLTFKNCGDRPAPLYFATSQRYEFTIEDATGVEVWRWSEGQQFAQVTGEEQVPPGETLTYKGTWDQKTNDGDQAPPGRYKILALSVGCAERTAKDCRMGPVGFVEILP